MPKPKKSYLSPQDINVDTLYRTVAGRIRDAQKRIVQTIDHEMVKAYWLIGRDIVEEEQQGQARAGYGKAILTTLSGRLQIEFGRGFGESTLTQIRKFYLEYQPVNAESNSDTVCTELAFPSLLPNLGWSHYRILMRIKHLPARQFYEIETNQNQWPSRILKRQIDSLLYERLAMSQDKEKVMALSQKGHTITQPQDVIKDPLVLEFLGLPQHPALSESELESALINHMQHFLLELGKGFAFVSRQKSIVVEGKYYRPDLVFYHFILKSFVIIDIKIDELSHGDLGQMQFYVNYFDQEIRNEADNPTIGLILCTDKNNAMVRYTLGEKAKQIFASQYQFHLPSEAELAAELKKEVQEIEAQLAQQDEEESRS